MALDKSNFKMLCEVLDKDGNGQRITFEQFGINYPMLLELQGKVVQPAVQNVYDVTTGWHKAAVVRQGNEPPAVEGSPSPAAPDVPVSA